MKFCPQCGAELSAGSRFCHNCGRAVGAPRPAPGVRVAWIVAGGAVALLLVVLALRLFRQETAAPTAAGSFAGGAPVQAGPPDLAQMTPREAADRLFDRVMRAQESGDTATVIQFGPMAREAYRMAGALDADARLHVGLIELANGNPLGALAQADTLSQEVETHLFATILRARALIQAGRRTDAAAAYRAFLRYESQERQSQRPEYGEHETLLEQFAAEARAAAGGPVP